MNTTMKQVHKRGTAAWSLIGVFILALAVSGCGPGKGNLSISSEPSGAQVYVNGSMRGTAPLKLTGLAPGEYVVELRKDGYDRAYKSAALLEKQDLAVDLEMRPTTGLLLVDSIPPGVDVVIAGVSKGSTPLLVSDLPLGSYKLEFHSPTHLPRTLSAELTDRKPVHVVADLVSNTAKLVVSSEPPGAEIRINGIAVGVTPATLSDVVSGESDIKIWKRGYTPFTQRMTLEATRTYRFNPELKALPSGLTVNSQPEGAAVVIDNKPVGTTPLTLDNLKEGPHQIVVSLPGYETASETIYLEPDLNDSAEFNLVKNSGSLMLVTEPANVKVYVGG
ncbi:MAG TPA: PEGA domain-containing protein, partial [Pontiella sp.]|nr:PEGA domain-containing protein [Pontiella sp.]